MASDSEDLTTFKTRFGSQADIDKCEFHVQKTKFLGLIISTDGIEIDPDKIQAVRDWTVPSETDISVPRVL